jgi:hypothetical protein
MGLIVVVEKQPRWPIRLHDLHPIFLAAVQDIGHGPTQKKKGLRG